MLQKRGLYGSICPYDLALDMGLELRFETIASLEGIYRAGVIPLILLNSLRPSGRRAYNCAHELGHHLFGHGTRIDVLLEQADEGFDPYEYMADRFASALLLPQVAVSRAFAARGWAAESCTAIDIFTIAGYFGVGYTTLIGYLQDTLGALPTARAEKLRRSSPKSIRRELVGEDRPSGSVVVVDHHWEARSVDMEVDDLMVLPNGGRPQGACIVTDRPGRLAIVRAARPGLGAIEIASASIAVRVSRRDYRGLADYRFDEDPDEQES
jgi:hypothetical protein